MTVQQYVRMNAIYNISRSGNCPRFRGNHDSFVSNADRAGIHEIRGPPHWCKVSIVVTQLDVQHSAYRIADHWFEIDTLFLATCTSACISIPISMYFLYAVKRNIVVSCVCWVQCIVRAILWSKRFFFDISFQTEHFGCSVKPVLQNEFNFNEEI